MLAHIRGGGEEGTGFHRDGALERKQHSYDDLYAVAEDIAARGIADPARIAVLGGSNGGLMVAVAVTQRPDLWCAACSLVPVTDMLRYHLSPYGETGLREYGDPDDPADAAVLRAYSPYHDVRPGGPTRRPSSSRARTTCAARPGTPASSWRACRPRRGWAVRAPGDGRRASQHPPWRRPRGRVAGVPAAGALPACGRATGNGRAGTGMTTRLRGLRRPSRWQLAFAIVAVVGLALRVWVYRSILGVPNADEAIVGLMARHVLDGQLTAFYWGQAYAGSQEALVTAPLFLVAGSSWLALRIVPIVLSAVAALLVWRVGRRTIGEPAAAVAGAVFWLWPAFNVFQLTHQQGLYASDVVYCALLLLLALRVVERPDLGRVGILGLVLGLAFWQTAQIVPVALPIVAWTM